MAKDNPVNIIIRILLLVYCVALTIIIAVLHSELKIQEQIIISMQKEISTISEKVYWDE